MLSNDTLLYVHGLLVQTPNSQHTASMLVVQFNNLFRNIRHAFLIADMLRIVCRML